jgi:acyl-CoA dehydrogenase
MSEFARELTDLIRNLAADAGDTGSVWGQVCELGLAGIGMPEDNGGSGGSLADLVGVVRELARDCRGVDEFVRRRCRRR